MKIFIASIMMFMGVNVLAMDKIQLSKNNTLSLNGPINGASAAKLFEEARKLDSETPSKDPIYLVLYTPGGASRLG